VSSQIRPHYTDLSRAGEITTCNEDWPKEIDADRLKRTTPGSDVIKSRRKRASHALTPVVSNFRAATSDQTDRCEDRPEKTIVPLPQATGNRKRRLLNTIFGCSPAAAAGVNGDRGSPVSRTTRSLMHLQQGNYYKWNPDISVISAASSASARSPQRPPDVVGDDDNDEDAMMSASCGTSMTEYVDGEDSSNEADQSWKMNGFIESDDEEKDGETSVDDETSCSSITEQGSATDVRSTALSSSKARRNQLRHQVSGGVLVQITALFPLSVCALSNYVALLTAGYKRQLMCDFGLYRTHFISKL